MSVEYFAAAFVIWFYSIQYFYRMDGWLVGWLVGWIDAELRMHVFYRIYNYFYVITKHFVMTVFITMLSDHLLMFEYDTRERKKKQV